MKEFISFIDFTNMSDEEKYKLLNSKDKEIERLIISLQAQEELTMNEHIKVERLNNSIDKSINKIQYIIDYGFDYDGFNNVEDLKGLIDMLVQYAIESKKSIKGK